NRERVLKIRKSIMNDILLNIIAVMLPISVLQFISLPYIGKVLGSETYGEIVFIISVFTFISFPIGNVLNNVRLLNNEQYEKREITGDFNLLVLYSIIIGIIMFVAYSTQNNFLNKIDILLILLIIILTITKENIIFNFRLVLNFKGIVLNNIYLAVGYLIRNYIFVWTNYWEFIYIIGLILSNIYIYKNTSLVREGLGRTRLFRNTLKDSLYLYSAGIVKNLVTHADKLLLYHLLGPQNVAIYYSSSIIGKMISMFVNPANTVILSYLVKSSKKVKMLSYLFISVFLGSVFYLLILLIGPLFLEIFYSAWSKESVLLLKYTAAASIVSVIANLFRPFNMRFNDLKWQLYINGSYLIIYITLTIMLTKQYGIIGFAIGVLIA